MQLSGGVSSTYAVAPSLRFWLLAPEDAATPVFVRDPSLARDYFLHRRARGLPLQEPGLLVQTLEGFEFLAPPELSVPYCRLENAQGLVVNLQGNGKGMTVLSAVGE